MRYCLIVLLAGLFFAGPTFATVDLQRTERVPVNSVYHPPVQPPPILAAAVTEYQLAYDSDPEWFFPTMDSVNAEWAVRFTAPQACSLSYFELTTYSDPLASGLVGLTLYDGDSASGPDAPILATVTFEASGDLSRQMIILDPPVDMGSGDFFISIKVESSVSPHVTGDGDGGTGRTWYRGPTQAWDWVEDVDINLRAYVILYGNDVSPPVIMHYPDPAAFAGDGQVAIAAAVTDGSGLQSVNLHYSTNMGTSYQSFPMFPSNGLYRGTIPAQLPNSEVLYYIEAADNAPAHNGAVDPASGAQAPHRYATYTGRQLKYDDGWPAYFMIVSEVFNDNAFAVLFTPTTYPVAISKLRVYVSEPASFKLSIRRATMGQPGTVWAGPYTISAATSPGWAEVEIPEIAQPLITAGHFYIMLEWLPSTPTMPGVGVDTMSVDGRSMWYDAAEGWATWPYADWMIRAVYTSPTGVFEEEAAALPDRFELAQNYPNPFNPNTTIEYSMPQPGQVSLSIYNIQGRKVRHYDLGIQGAGSHRIEWDGRDENGRSSATGVYYYRLTAGETTHTRKMILLK